MLTLQIFTAAVAFRFDRESMRPLLRLPLQQFAYRQLMYLVLIQSATTALTGGRLRWHKLNRAGLTPRSPGPDPAPPPRAGVAPAVDSWPPARPGIPPSQPRPPVGRAVARPAVPMQPRHSEDLPTAGSPPADLGPVRAGWTPDQGAR
jgi:hypothetical protein